MANDVFKNTNDLNRSGNSIELPPIQPGSAGDSMPSGNLVEPNVLSSSPNRALDGSPLTREGNPFLVCNSVSAPAEQPRSPAVWSWRAPDPSLAAPRDGAWVENPDGVSQADDLGQSGYFVAAAVRGRGHKQDGVFCDDSFDFLEVTGWRVVIVSDGAGSAPFSRVGSDLACKSARASLESGLVLADLSAHHLDEANLGVIQQTPELDPFLARACEAMAKAFLAAHQSIQAWVSQQNEAAHEKSAVRLWVDNQYRGPEKEQARLDPEKKSVPLRVLVKDCNCTLLIVAYSTVLLKKSDGTQREMGLSLSSAVGDGMTVVFRRPNVSNNVLPLMSPDIGEFSGQTQFIDGLTTSAESFKARRRLLFVGAHSDIIAVAAMTDGVADDYYGGKKGMERLYCDLILNGVLPSRLGVDGLEQGEEFKNSQSGSVFEILVEPRGEGGRPRTQPVKYADRYLACLGLTEASLLSNPSLLHDLATGDPNTMPENATPKAEAERLRIWLDAYTVQGSFDDRTLVMFRNRGAVT